jgi:hypothetical protein
MSYDHYKGQICYHVNKCRVTYMAKCFQCGLKSAIQSYGFFFTYKFILNTYIRFVAFVTPNFALNIIFSSMLSTFEL